MPEPCAVLPRPAPFCGVDEPVPPPYPSSPYSSYLSQAGDASSARFRERDEASARLHRTGVRTRRSRRRSRHHSHRSPRTTPRGEACLSVGVQQLSCSTLSTLGAAPTTDPRQSHRVHSLPLLHRRHLRPCRAVHRQGRRTGTTVLSSPGGGTPEGAGPTCTPNCAPASPTRLALPRCVDGAISPTLLAIGQGARSAGAAAGGGGRATGAAAHGAGAQPRQRRAVEGGSLGAVSPWGRLTAAHRGANDPLR